MEKARALGDAPKSSLGLGLAQIVSTIRPAAGSITLRLSLAALAHDDVLPVGRDGQGGGVQPGEDLLRFARRPGRSSVTLPSLAMKRSGSTRTLVPRPAGPVTSPGPGLRPPQLDTYGLAADQHHVERVHAHVEGPQHAARVGVELQQRIGEIAANVEPLPVGRDGQPGRDLGLPPRGVGRRQGNAPAGPRPSLGRRRQTP